MDKIDIVVACVVVSILTVVVGAISYGAHLKAGCVGSAMQNKYDAVSIQAICKF